MGKRLKIIYGLISLLLTACLPAGYEFFRENLSEYERVKDKNLTHFWRWDYPYGEWITLNKDFKLTVRKDDTYEICYRDNCDTNSVSFQFYDDEKTRLYGAILENFFEVSAGKSYIANDFYHRLDNPKRREVSPPKHLIITARPCYFAPSGWCFYPNRDWTSRNLFVYQKFPEDAKLEE